MIPRPRHPRRLLPLLAAVGLLAAPRAVAGGSPAYLVTELPGLACFGNTRVEQLNDAGQAVGHSNTPSLALPAVSWTDGVVTDLDGRSSFSQALGVSEGGVVAGHLPDAGGSPEAVVWVDGVPQFLGALAGDLGSRAHDVDDAGLACGVSLGDVTDRAVVWQDGAVSALSDASSAAFAVNASGRVVGRRTVGVMVQAMVWEDGDATVLPDLGEDSAGAVGVGDTGFVAGHARSAEDGLLHAVVWTPELALVDLGLFDG